MQNTKKYRAVSQDCGTARLGLIIFLEKIDDRSSEDAYLSLVDGGAESVAELSH